MKKFFTILLVLLLVAGAALGGVYVYFSFSKSPTAVTTRTLANLENVESVSMNMQVDTGVVAEVGLLQFFGLSDPATTVSMNYDLDMYKEPSMMHANINISAFDFDALKDLEAIIAEENGEVVQYYHWNGKWYRYVAQNANADESTGTESATDDAATNDDMSKSAIGSFNKPGMKVSFVPVSAEMAKKLSFAQKLSSKKADDQANATASQTDATEAVDFKTLLESYVDGSLQMEMREENETINEKECFVFDVDMTGDMLEKVIRFTSGDKGLIPELTADEHVTGQLYINADTCLPEALKLSTGEILSEKLNFEEVGLSLSVTKVDIDVNVKGYNLGTVATVPDEYVDINNLDDLNAEQWLELALDFTGLGDLMNSYVTQDAVAA